jgi:probable addiction module antidote protein
MRDLLDPTEAASYLNAAIDDPEEETLLLALRDVAEAHQLARVAREAGIARESIYRSLSATGNPRTTTLRNIVRVLGLRFHFEANGKTPEILNEDPTETANRLAQFNQRHALNSTIQRLPLSTLIPPSVRENRNTRRASVSRRDVAHLTLSTHKETKRCYRKVRHNETSQRSEGAIHLVT